MEIKFLSLSGLSQFLTNLSSKFAKISHSHTKSEITDFPTSMKNPTTLKIQFNGTDMYTYDGSAAKTVNIIPSSIGAATSSHIHNYAGSSSAGGAANVSNRLALTNGRATNANLDLKNTTTNGMQLMIATSSMTTNKPITDGYIQTYSWDTNAGYGAQLFISHSGDTRLQVRGCNAGTWETSWRTILDSNNYTSYVPMYSDATTGTAGLMSATDKAKLDGITTEIISATEPTSQSVNDYWIQEYA